MDGGELVPQSRLREETHLFKANSVNAVYIKRFARNHNPKMDDPFHVLNLHRSASQDEIKKRYLTLAKQWHPDTQYSKDELSRIEAERQFKRIQQAFTLASRKHQVPGHYPNPYVSINMPVNEHYRCCFDDVSHRV